MFKHFRIQLVFRALLLVGSALLLAYLVGWSSYFYAPLAVALTLPMQIVGLVRYAERATRDVNHFLDSIRQADFSQGVLTGQQGPLFDELSRSFEAVMDEFKQVRAEKEAHFRYLQTVVQHVGLALIAYRPDGTIDLVNSAAKRLLGQAQLRNINDLRAFSEDLVDTLQTLPSGEQALVKVTEDDEELQLAIYTTHFRLRGVHHVLVSLQDLRPQLEEKEMEAWQQLTRVLTHEIMNSTAPIASLAATASQILARVTAPTAAELEHIDDTREALGAIERRSEALMHFVDSYRSFTKIARPNIRTFEVLPLLQQVHRLLSVQAAEQEIAIAVEVHPETLALTADPELIEQVLINLLLNAMDALEGHPAGRIRLEARLNRHGHPLIQVFDNGPGIAPELRERIFVPFFSTRAEGSGIGLSLSRQIMRAHGGSLSVRSTPDTETVFTLRF